MPVPDKHVWKAFQATSSTAFLLLLLLDVTLFAFSFSCSLLLRLPPPPHPQEQCRFQRLLHRRLLCLCARPETLHVRALFVCVILDWFVVLRANTRAFTESVCASNCALSKHSLIGCFIVCPFLAIPICRWKLRVVNAPRLVISHRPCTLNCPRWSGLFAKGWLHGIASHSRNSQHEINSA